jgi:pimeloyl-ACP methyl ester carboxylesterase
MLQFTHTSGQHLHVDDVRLYYEVTGDRSGPPLVLLHGGLGSLADFNSILDELPRGYRVVGIDFRGHGKSTLGSANMSYQLHQRDVTCILDHLGIAACTLLGFSDGGIVAYRMAAQTPERVSALVTVGAQWRLEKDGPVHEMLRGLTAEAWEEMFPDSVEYYRSVNPQPAFSALVRAVVSSWTDLTTEGYPGEDVRKIAAPSLFVRGDNDPLLSLQEVVELRQRVTSAQLFNIPCAGHEVHADSPGLFLAGVKAFFEHLATCHAPSYGVH